MIGKIRDLTRISRPGAKDLLLAFDVIGGIGPLRADAVCATPEDVGYFGARVVVMELLSLGAVPILLADLLTLSWGEGGERVVTGVRALLAEAGFPNVPVTGSTEENVPAAATGAGFVGVGEVEPQRIRHGRARAGDRLYLWGMPKSAPKVEVQRSDPDIAHVAALGKLMEDNLVHEALPLGSGGLETEFAALRRRMLRPALDRQVQREIIQMSGGPATAVLLVVNPKWEGVSFGIPLQSLGELQGD